MASILSTYPKKRKRRVTAGFMGTYIPKSQADYVTLYCNAFEVPKISIMKDLLTAWVNAQLKKHSTDDLVEKIVTKAFAVWGKTEGKSFDTFISLLQFELKKKKLPPETVGTIINLLKDEKTKSDKA